MTSATVGTGSSRNSHEIRNLANEFFAQANFPMNRVSQHTSFHGCSSFNSSLQTAFIFRSCTSPPETFPFFDHHFASTLPRSSLVRFDFVHFSSSCCLLKVSGNRRRGECGHHSDPPCLVRVFGQEVPTRLACARAQRTALL